jgi:hypothetical protein
LHVNEARSLWGGLSCHIRWHIHDELSKELEVEEERDDGGGVVHGFNEGIVEFGLIHSIARLPETKIGDDVHCHASEGEKQVRWFASSILAGKSRAEVVDLGRSVVWLLLICGGEVP